MIALRYNTMIPSYCRLARVEVLQNIQALKKNHLNLRIQGILRRQTHKLEEDTTPKWCSKRGLRGLQPTKNESTDKLQYHLLRLPIWTTFFSGLYNAPQ